MTNLFQNQEIISKFNKIHDSPYKNFSDHYSRLKKIQNNRYLVLPKSLKNLYSSSPSYISKTKLTKSIEKNINNSIQINFNTEGQYQKSQMQLQKKLTFIKIIGRPNLTKIKQKMQKKTYSILQPLKNKKNAKENEEQRSKEKSVNIFVQKICFKTKKQKQLFSNLRATKKNRVRTQAIQSLTSQKINLNEFYIDQETNIKTLSPQLSKRRISFKKQSKTSHLIQKKIKKDYIQPWEQSHYYQTEQNQSENQFLCFQKHD